MLAVRLDSKGPVPKLAHRCSVVSSQKPTLPFGTWPTVSPKSHSEAVRQQGWFNIFRHISAQQYYMKIKFFIKTARHNSHCYSPNTVFIKTHKHTRKHQRLQQDTSTPRACFSIQGGSPVHCGRGRLAAEWAELRQENGRSSDRR